MLIRGCRRVNTFKETSLLGLSGEKDFSRTKLEGEEVRAQVKGDGSLD